MLKVAIIGAGFSGTMAAVHLMRQTDNPVHITLFDQRDCIAKGVAYNPYSSKHLLNVTTSKMSAFPDLPGHFLDWVKRHPAYEDIESHLVANSFLPRKLYGDYLSDIWTLAKDSMPEMHRIIEKNSCIVDLQHSTDGYILTDAHDNTFEAQKVLLATGNETPGDVQDVDFSTLDNSVYFRNPWDNKCVLGTDPSLPILILGNGLTMVDTVIGLRENGFKNIIYSLSPNGFQILPHRHPGLDYNIIQNDIESANSLLDLVRITNRHIKKIRSLGISAEPIINALRSQTPDIWKRLTDEEKKIFYRRIRHLWGVARHRLPLHIHDEIQNERIRGTLKVYSGRVTNVEQVQDGIIIKYLNKKSRTHQKVFVSRIINCTGPVTDLLTSRNTLLANLVRKNFIEQDPLRLGINADSETYIASKNGNLVEGLYIIGSLLKGVLWESTAVGELRQQAQQVSKTILRSLHYTS